MSDQDEVTLSTGAVRVMRDTDSEKGENDPIADEPILQILSVKKVQTPGATERFRLILSDGQHFMQAMLATQLNYLLATDPPAFEKNTVIKLTSYACNVVQNRRIVIALAIEVIAQPLEKIGNPASIDLADSHTEDVPMQQAAPAKDNGRVANTKTAKKVSGPPKGVAPVYPIEGLSPYQNKWTIKARVTVKSDIRTWTNAKGEGKLFSVNLLDDTGEIKATGFNDAVDKLYSVFEEGKVYYISKARVNIAKKQFSNLTGEYEIMLEAGTEVTLCEDQESAPKIQYNFTELGNLESFEKDATCDVLGIIKEDGDLSEITAKASGKIIKKRELVICDRSGYSVKVTLWGKAAENWTDSKDSVFAFKGAKVGDFGGRTLSMGGQSTMAADPDIPEAHDLRGWYDTEGQNANFASYSSGGAGAGGATSFKKEEFMTLEQTKTENFGTGEKPEYFSVRGTILLVKTQGTMWYPACPADKCNKKMSQEEDGQWRCEKCDKFYPAAENRYVMSLCMSDFTDQIWLSTFNEVGEQIIGHSADVMNEWKDAEDPRFNAAIAAATGTMYNFGCRAKAESYQDVTRVRFHATKVSKVDWVDSGRQLLEMIKGYGN